MQPSTPRAVCNPNCTCPPPPTPFVLQHNVPSCLHHKQGGELVGRGGASRGYIINHMHEYICTRVSFLPPTTRRANVQARNSAKTVERHHRNATQWEHHWCNTTHRGAVLHSTQCSTYARATPHSHRTQPLCQGVPPPTPGGTKTTWTHQAHGQHRGKRAQRHLEPTLGNTAHQ